MPNRRPLVPGRASSVLTAALLAPAAVFFAAAAHADPGNPDQAPAPAAEDAPPCCADIEAAPPPELPPGPEPGPEPNPEPAEATPVANVDMAPQALPPGIANEHGLQVKTILVSRSISEAFPQVGNMIGVRPDGQRWHPSGLALDIMIPNSSSPEGVALGDQIVAYALQNSGRFALQDAIWRGTYYTPAGPSGRGNGHFDHVHITTLGGGYPTGAEEYPREDGAPPPADQQV